MKNLTIKDCLEMQENGKISICENGDVKEVKFGESLKDAQTKESWSKIEVYFMIFRFLKGLEYTPTFESEKDKLIICISYLIPELTYLQAQEMYELGYFI